MAYMYTGDIPLTLHHDIDISIHSNSNLSIEAINLENNLTIVGTSVCCTGVRNTQSALCLVESTLLHVRIISDVNSR